MSANLKQISRPQKHEIATKILSNLTNRKVQGPAEPALDAYIVELTNVAAALGIHVTASTLADAKRTARIARLQIADDLVDTWYRHVESYVDVEAGRKYGPHAPNAAALYKAAFPDGLAHVDDPIADENRTCRDALLTLRSGEHAETVQAIELPIGWLGRWEAALDESDAAFKDVEAARTDKHAHVGAGRDAEGEWVELFVRLRRYISSRAKRSELAKIQEGKTLLAPLLDVLAKMKAQAAARVTRSLSATEEPATNG